VVELIGGLDGFAQRKVAGQDDVFSAERDDEGALHGPGTYPRNCGEFGHKLVVWQSAQDVRVQAAVRHALGEVTECAGLPPREPGLAELAGIDAQQVGGRWKMAAEQGDNAGQGPARRRDGQLLAGDLEQQLFLVRVTD
jgi:hypothetical protein